MSLDLAPWYHPQSLMDPPDGCLCPAYGRGKTGKQTAKGTSRPFQKWDMGNVPGGHLALSSQSLSPEDHRRWIDGHTGFPQCWVL